MTSAGASALATCARSPSQSRLLSVAHVVLSLQVGGMERVVLHLANQGKLAGHRVRVICLEKPGLLGEQAKSMGLDVISLGKQPGLTPGLVGEIRGVLRETRLDVVHTHQIGALLYAGPAARKERVPVVVHTEHINNVAKSRTFSRRLRVRLLWGIAGRYADRFCCVSQDTADAARMTVRATKLRVIQNGIPLADFDAANHRESTRASLAIGPGTMVIGVVARLDEVKCQDLLIRAFASARKAFPESCLLLVGDGPRRKALIQLVAELGLEPVVHFAGYQSEPHRYLQAMDVFVLPSRLEGMPLAILEAWAARLPVVASRVGGVPQVVADGQTGLLFESGDQAALEKLLLQVMADASLRDRLGTAGRRRVEADFDTRRMAADYQQQYSEILHLSPNV
jgi:glycosyltransferase involved in cell wall biosynthesis